MKESDLNATYRALCYKGLLTGIAFFSNYDTYSEVRSETANTFGNKNIDNASKEYHFMGGSAIVTNSIALILILSLYCKYIFDNYCYGAKNKQKIELPTMYLVFVVISCVLSIVGSSLLMLSEDQNKMEHNNYMHTFGAALFAASKFSNPLLTSIFAAYSLIESEKNKVEVDQEDAMENGTASLLYEKNSGGLDSGFRIGGR